jgi:uncharacterized repeat protein (TIGR01451 family)
MKFNSLTAIVLVLASLVGGAWMQAQDAPPPVPPVTEESPPTPARPKKSALPRIVKEQAKPAIVEASAPADEGAPEHEARIGTEVAAPASAGIRARRTNGPKLVSHEEPAPFADLLNKHTEQAVTIEWIGPVQIKVGQPFVYEIVVHNAGSQPASDVVVRSLPITGMVVKQTDPPTEQETDGFVWRLGQLEPRQDKRIKLEMIAEQRGELICNATVTATSPATARFRVSEPKLAIKHTTPEKVMVGDPASIAIAVTNPGDGPAERVVVRSQLSEGLKHEKGSAVSYELGTLAAGETRTIRLVCQAIRGGQQQIQSVATAEGGLQANAEDTFAVAEAKLVSTIAGPKLRYLERSATYTVAVNNPGDAPATNVKLLVNVPEGFKFTKSSGGGQHDYATRSVAWFVGDINPGESKEVQYQCLAVQPGPQKHVAVCTAQRGLRSEADIVTMIEGISALLLEVVDVDDPIEVGADTAYEIRVTNQGSREATNVEVHALVPRELQIRSAQGPTEYRQEGQSIVFAPIPRLAPRADAIYRVFVRGAGVGDVRFRARLVSESLSEPVIEEESTKVYND